MTYLIEHDICWCAKIKIADMPKALEACKEVNEFFSGHKDRLEDAGGDVIKAALSLYAPEIIANAWGGKGTVTQHINNIEGFFPLDGSHGMVLESCDRFCWGDEEFSVKAVN